MLDSGGDEGQNEDFGCQRRGMRSLPMEKGKGDAVNITGRDIVLSADSTERYRAVQPLPGI